MRRIGAALAVLVVASTAASLLYNAVTSGRDVAATKLYPGPWMEVDGTRLAYRRWGAHGTPIVLVGGFIESSWVWHEVGPILGQTHRVYALDLPPFGYSQRRGPYTLARWTELVEGFERRLGIRRPVLVGHSLGAAVAVSVATETPRAESGIVLLDGDALPGNSGGAWLTHLLVPPWFTSAYRIATGSDWLFRRGLRSAWGLESPPFTDAFIDAWQRPFRVAGHGVGVRLAARPRHPGRFDRDDRERDDPRARRVGKPRHGRLRRGRTAHGCAHACPVRRDPGRRPSVHARAAARRRPRDRTPRRLSGPPRPGLTPGSGVRAPRYRVTRPDRGRGQGDVTVYDTPHAAHLYRCPCLPRSSRAIVQVAPAYGRVHVLERAADQTERSRSASFDGTK